MRAFPACYTSFMPAIVPLPVTLSAKAHELHLLGDVPQAEDVVRADPD
jgi:hypothetical protein